MEDYNFSCQFTADLIAMNTAGGAERFLMTLCTHSHVMLIEDEGNDSDSLYCQFFAKQAASLSDFVFTMPVHLERKRHGTWLVNLCRSPSEEHC